MLNTGQTIIQLNLIEHGKKCIKRIPEMDGYIFKWFLYTLGDSFKHFWFHAECLPTVEKTCNVRRLKLMKLKTIGLPVLC